MLDKQQLKWFEDLTQLDAISGHEQAIASYLHKEYEKVADTVLYDQLGSIVALKKSKHANAKKVLVLGHMDEVGFMVKAITETGVLKIHPVGGWFDQVLLAQRVRVTSRQGAVFPGTLLSKPLHMLSPRERNAVVKIENMVVDVGAVNRQEVLDMGIQIGDMIVLEGQFQSLNNGKRIMAKAFDNRYGCVLGLDVLTSLQDIELDFDLYVGASVQEEVGLRGAQTITQLIHPDFAVVLDCSPANDALDVNAQGRLGAGVLLRMMDGGMIANKDVMYRFQDVCDKVGAPYQFYYSPGGTDAGIVHKSDAGIPTLTCCVVARNLHTSSGILDTDDYQAARLGLLAYLQSNEWGDVHA